VLALGVAIFISAIPPLPGYSIFLMGSGFLYGWLGLVPVIIAADVRDACSSNLVVILVVLIERIQNNSWAPWWRLWWRDDGRVRACSDRSPATNRSRCSMKHWH
jgi:hypothetical protein